MGSDPVVVIVGPTASGKSDVAMQIARTHNGEIICADSRTVYRGMDVLTAKPTKEDQRAVKHWCLDVVDPGERWTAHDWQKMAQQAIADIHRRHHVPVVVGGTGLYVEALLYQFSFSNSASNTQQLAKLTLTQLASKAQSIFGESALPPDIVGNRRYLEKAITTGRLPRSVHRRVLPPNVLLVGINPGRELLRSRIQHRVDTMIEGGLLAEIARLPSEPIGEAGTAIAYRPFKAHIAGYLTLEDAKAAFVQGDLKLAKKQITWFKRDPNIVWFGSGQAAAEYLEKKLALF